MQGNILLFQNEEFRMTPYVNQMASKWTSSNYWKEFVSFISYSLSYYDFFSKSESIIFEDTKNIVMNDFMYTIKLNNSRCTEISPSPTRRCLLQTGRQTFHDSMSRWNNYFKEARTKNCAEHSLNLLYVLHILKGY